MWGSLLLSGNDTSAVRCVWCGVEWQGQAAGWGSALAREAAGLGCGLHGRAASSSPATPPSTHPPTPTHPPTGLFQLCHNMLSSGSSPSSMPDWQVLTPFEKNLEVWRQLWRVLERSDIVVQASGVFFY